MQRSEWDISDPKVHTYILDPEVGIAMSVSMRTIASIL